MKRMTYMQKEYFIGYGIVQNIIIQKHMEMQLGEEFINSLVKGAKRTV